MDGGFALAYQIIALVCVIGMLLPGLFLVIWLGASAFHSAVQAAKAEMLEVLGVNSRR